MFLILEVLGWQVSTQECSCRYQVSTRRYLGQHKCVQSLRFGFGVWGLGSGVRVSGFEFRFGCRFQRLGFRCSWFRIQGLGFQVHGFRGWGFGVEVLKVLGFKVGGWGFGVEVQGFWFRVWSYGLGFWVFGVEVRGSWFGVRGSWFGVLGLRAEGLRLGARGQGLGFRFVFGVRV